MGVIDEHLRTDVLPGDGSPTSGKPGPADDMLASNIKVNAIGDLVSAGRLSETELSATIAEGVQAAGAPLFTSQQKGASRLAAKLDGWADTTCALFFGDSTGNWTDEWIRLTLNDIGNAYPALTTSWHLWQEHVATFGINETVQEGAGLVEVVTDTFTRTASDLATTKPDIGEAEWAGSGWSLNGAQAVWGSGSNMVSLNSGVAGDFDAEWTLKFTPTAATTGQTFRVVSRMNTAQNIRLFAEITANTTTNWVLRLTKLTPTLASLGAIPINGADLAYAAGTQTMRVRMTLTGDQLSVRVNDAVATPALTATLTQADLTALSAGTSYGVQGGIVSAQMDGLTIKSRQPTSRLRWYNASVPGAGISYFTDSRLESMTPPSAVDLLVFNLGHNAGAQDGSAFGPLYEAFIDKVRLLHPNAGVMVSSQNPQKSGTLASYPSAQFSRMVAVREMCARRNFSYIPAMEAFMASTHPYHYVKSDGIHPTTFAEAGAENGQKVWTSAALAAFKRDGLTRLP